jgi:hypothetical protein
MVMTCLTESQAIPAFAPDRLLSSTSALNMVDITSWYHDHFIRCGMFSMRG